MSNSRVDRVALSEFEQGLNIRHPYQSRIPARVLGYGEISTVLEIQSAQITDLAYKRMSMFRSEAEVTQYEALYREYLEVLQNRCGVQVVAGELIKVQTAQGKVVAYIAQEKLPPESIAHHALQLLPNDEVLKLIETALRETRKVFDFNRAHANELELGFDGQISNWAIVNFDAQAQRLPDDLCLVYLDTSTPLLRKNGREQLDPELFLRSAPFFLAWLLRLLYLDEVLTRYYDFRRVALDLVANFYKEQRADLIPALIDLVNATFAADDDRLKPLTAEEVAAYYKQDAQLWSVYLAARKVDRLLHRAIGKEYPYILPEKIKR